MSASPSRSGATSSPASTASRSATSPRGSTSRCSISRSARRADAVRPLLPPGWEIATPGYMMTAPVAAMLDRPPMLPDGFVARHRRATAPITFATIADPAGEEAARGRIIAMDDLVVFDRIRTADAHQRRGLGSAIMRALAAEADALGIRDAMLCATPPGRALYDSARLVAAQRLHHGLARPVKLCHDAGMATSASRPPARRTHRPRHPPRRASSRCCSPPPTSISASRSG